MEAGRLWFVYSGRAHWIPFDLAKSLFLFAHGPFDIVLDDFITDAFSTARVLRVVNGTALLAYRHLISRRAPGGRIRFRRYDLPADHPTPELQSDLAKVAGAVIVEQLWTRWDPRHQRLAATWQWFGTIDYNQDGTSLPQFGSDPSIYTEDFGDTWLCADGTPIHDLPLGCHEASSDSRLTPYDHLAFGELGGWHPRDIGFTPNGAPWITLPVGDTATHGGSMVGFFHSSGSSLYQEILTCPMARALIRAAAPSASGVSRDFLASLYSQFTRPGEHLIRVSGDNGRF